jgi:microcystin-dependent protein
MSEPFVGEIKMFAGNFAPYGWALCAGQLMPISENEALFNLIGTTYGGDGQETFGLPDLQGRVPIHMGQGPGLSQNYVIGEKAGVEQVTLSTQHIPIHSHVPLASSAAGTSDNPAGAVWAASSAKQFIVPSGPLGAVMAPLDTGSVGGSQPHDNMLPYLTINFIISLFGFFPSQT